MKCYIGYLGDSIPTIQGWKSLAAAMFAAAMAKAQGIAAGLEVFDDPYHFPYPHPVMVQKGAYTLFCEVAEEEQARSILGDLPLTEDEIAKVRGDWSASYTVGMFWADHASTDGPSLSEDLAVTHCSAARLGWAENSKSARYQELAEMAAAIEIAGTVVAKAHRHDEGRDAESYRDTLWRSSERELRLVSTSSGSAREYASITVWLVTLGDGSSSKAVAEIRQALAVLHRYGLRLPANTGTTGV